MNATDPTGFISDWLYVLELIIAGFTVNTVLAQTVVAVHNGVNPMEAFIYGLSAAAFSGAQSALPSFGAGLRNALVRAAGVGVVGGITSLMRGGHFGHGFRNSAIGAAAGSAAAAATGVIKNGFRRFVTRVAAGGTVSELSGGKFRNGAISAAFQTVIESGFAKTDDELRASVVQRQSEEDLISPELEEETLEQVYENAAKLGIDVPDHHEWEYIDKIGIGKMNAAGFVVPGSLRYADDLSTVSESEVVINAVTNMKTGKTIYFRGIASPSWVESMTEVPGNEVRISMKRRGGIENAIFSVGHEMAHVRGVKSELVANQYGDRALFKYSLFGLPSRPGQ